MASMIVLFEKLFSAISSIIIFVICRSAKKYAHGKSMKKILRQTFSVFEPELSERVQKMTSEKTVI